MSEKKRAVVQGQSWKHGEIAGVTRADFRGRLVVPPGTIPWDVHLNAWAGYAKAGHGAQSAERINERGGFGYREVQCALLGHYNRCGVCEEEHSPVPGWEEA